MSRSQYNPNADLGEFSKWHRTLPGWYRYIDIDYLGYQIVNGEYTPYVAIERIRLTDTEPTKGPTMYPLEDHKREVYLNLANGLHIPAYTMWHKDDCDVFTVQSMKDESDTVSLTGASELMNWLDQICKKQFGGLGYRR